MNRNSAAACLLVLVLIASACGSSTTGASDAPTTDSSTTDSSTIVAPAAETSSTTVAQPEGSTAPAESTAPADSTAPAESTAPPESTASAGGEQADVTASGVRDQIIAWMSGDAVASAEDYERIFTSTFRNTVGRDEFNSIWAQTAPIGPWTVFETFGEDSTGGGFLLVGAMPEPKLLLTIGIVDGQVEEALLQPWAPPPVSFDDAVAAVDALGRTSFLISEVIDGTCVSVVDSGAEEIISLGSVFKLIVLGAVVDAVAEGIISWDDLVEIRDELDSYPSGTTQDVEPGTQMTVRELAELMISISDNTATDHLIDLVTRDRVEAAQSAYGITQPELNQPFLTTRELFQMKVDSDLRERYLTADENERRLILDEVAELPLAPVEEAVAGWTGPIEVETLEWFATPSDICRVLANLDVDGDAAAILELNPGFPSEANRWDTIGFKGGSEPGVLATAWIVTDADGRTFTIVGAAVSDGVIDDIGGAVAFAGLRDQFEVP